MKTDDEIIDYLLQRAVDEEKDGGVRYKISDILAELGIDREATRTRIIAKIKDENLGEIKDGGRVNPTSQTNHIYDSGGYLAYIRREKSTKGAIENYYTNQGNLSGWYYRYRWVPFALSIAALAISLLAYLHTLFFC